MGRVLELQRGGPFEKQLDKASFKAEHLHFTFLSSMFSHLALRRPPSQQLQFLRNKPNNPTPHSTPPTTKKTTKQSFEQRATRRRGEQRCFQLPTHQILFLTVWLLRRNLLRLYFHPSKEANSVEAPSTGNDNSTERVFHVLCFCCFPVRVSSGRRRGAEGSAVASQQTWPFCVLRVYMTLHVLVSASLQALLRPPAAQRQERFRSPAPTHRPHGASVDSRWPLLCRLYWPIVWGVTPPLIPDSWGEKNLQHPLATPSAGDAVIEGGRKGG